MPLYYSRVTALIIEYFLISTQKLHNSKEGVRRDNILILIQFLCSTCHDLLLATLLLFGNQNKAQPLSCWAEHVLSMETNKAQHVAPCLGVVAAQMHRALINRWSFNIYNIFQNSSCEHHDHHITPRNLKFKVGLGFFFLSHYQSIKEGGVVAVQ